MSTVLSTVALAKVEALAKAEDCIETAEIGLMEEPIFPKVFSIFYDDLSGVYPFFQHMLTHDENSLHTLIEYADTAGRNFIVLVRKSIYRLSVRF